MSDEFDDDAGVDSTFDDFEESKPTLGSVWQSNPLFKFGVIGVIALVIFGVVALSGGDEIAETPQQESRVPQAPDVAAAPGTDEATPAYIDAIEQQNEQDLEFAQATGGSALPVPIDPPVGVIGVDEEEAGDEDPLQRWRRLQEERLQAEMQQREELQAASVDNSGAQADAVRELADLLQSQMSSILDTKESTGIQSMNVTSNDFLTALREEDEEEEGGEGSEGGENSEDGFEEEIIQETLLQAGEIVYAQLLTEANTDAEMPVLARVLSGPFAGAKLIGSFTEEKELILITFDRLVLGDDIIDVSGMALDPETALPGMATEVDHHYLQRIFIPVAAAFVEGMASAIEETGDTTITINSNTGTTQTETEDPDDDEEVAAGIAEAGQELGEIIDEINDDLEVTVRLAAGTPIGVLFIEPVMSGEDSL